MVTAILVPEKNLIEQESMTHAQKGKSFWYHILEHVSSY